MKNVSNDDRPLEDLVEGVDYVFNGSIKIDAIKYKPEYKDFLHKVWLEAEAELPNWDNPNHDVPVMFKKILKERYGIAYRTHFELNPDVKFD